MRMSSVLGPLAAAAVAAGAMTCGPATAGGHQGAGAAPALEVAPPGVVSTLDRLTPGQRRALVADRDGWEAATWSGGKISFWRYERSWSRVGAGRYPSVSPSPTSPRAVGYLLPGMANVTFLLRGQFTGDGSADAMAFTASRRGWGPLALTTSDTLAVADVVPEAQVADTLFFGFQLAGGLLETNLESPYYPSALGELYPLLTQWRWVPRLARFTARATNAFGATRRSPPAPAAQLDSCPGPATSGTWDVRVQVRVDAAKRFAVDEPLDFEVLLPGGRRCHIHARFDMTVELTARTASRSTAWITAPASVLGSDLLPPTPGQPIPASLFGIRAGQSPYVIPPALHIVSIRSYLGLALVGTGPGTGVGSPWTGTLTWHHGTVTEATVDAGGPTRASRSEGLTRRSGRISRISRRG